MTLNSEDLINSILASLDRVKFISVDDIPNIELYMDQVTTFMDERLKSTARYPGEDKILPKTMITRRTICFRLLSERSIPRSMFCF